MSRWCRYFCFRPTSNNGEVVDSLLHFLRCGRIDAHCDKGEKETLVFIANFDAKLFTQPRNLRALFQHPRSKSNVLDELNGQAALPAHYQIDGPKVELSHKAAEVLGLAVHELTTNSTKYGVLSESNGTIRIRWSVEDRDGRAWLCWIWHEPAGSMNERPVRQGFGTDLIENRVPYELRGIGEIRIGDIGIRARIDFPLAGEQSTPETTIAKRNKGQ